ncbi:MAG: nucleotide sugar dehydrogenase [Thermomicrobiales bacterium]
MQASRLVATAPSELDSLNMRIASRTAKVGLIGLGYAGLPLAVAFAEAGFDVVGIDLQDARVDALNRGESYIGDIPSERVAALVAANTFRATADYAALADVDAITICVPTPLTADKGPDPSAVAAAARGIAPWLRPGQVIVLESTSYPGTTEEILLPAVSQSGLRVGEEIFVAFAPERVNPGDTQYDTRNTAKLVGGVTPACSEAAATLYGAIVNDVHTVSSPRVAEMAKLMENTFRQVNIAFANEMAIVCEHLGIDVWETIKAAATKPFGYLPFYPGPGLGGPCIPVVPHYLSWKSRQAGYEPRMIALADEVNEAMPAHVVALVERALASRGIPLAGARVLLLGITYKPDVSDTRVSPPMQILELLAGRGAVVAYHDPLVPAFQLGSQHIAGIALDETALAAADCVVITTNHSSFDWARVVRTASLVVDTRNATAQVPVEREARAQIVRLGTSVEGTR